MVAGHEKKAVTGDTSTTYDGVNTCRGLLVFLLETPVCDVTCEAYYIDPLLLADFDENLEKCWPQYPIAARCLPLHYTLAGFIHPFERYTLM
jgi:hypothetical protein